MDLSSSRFQVLGEPGPAVATDSAEFSDDIELDFFRSLPEEELQSLYPDGIKPPTDLGPVTAYDRYDQFHLAILHLASGIELRDVMRAGNFEISDSQFVRHMAIYCAQSLDYTDRDISKLRGKLLGASCTHVLGEQYCMHCSRVEFISMPDPLEKQRDVYSKNKTADQGVQDASLEEDATRKARVGSARSMLSETWFRLLWKYVLPLGAIWFLYESHIQPLFAN
ncbi:hypothetical protein H2200_009689 [Cladophialophora chaetospira]|uniref:Uncharacterized protein n=1 Tax=Cladophialophora chaetospira TaxID=386627 RepID=A0AA39CET1_9EURO|nr:hypothetical protein H2200_009689 [Cladophialophora chaetospira]